MLVAVQGEPSWGNCFTLKPSCLRVDNFSTSWLQHLEDAPAQASLPVVQPEGGTGSRTVLGRKGRGRSRRVQQEEQEGRNLVYLPG